LVCGISGDAKRAIRDWMNKRPTKIPCFIPEHKYTMGFLQRPAAKSIRKLLA
jgi:hypothetical protein